MKKYKIDFGQLKDIILRFVILLILIILIGFINDFKLLTGWWIGTNWIFGMVFISIYFVSGTILYLNEDSSFGEILRRVAKGLFLAVFAFAIFWLIAAIYMTIEIFINIQVFYMLGALNSLVWFLLLLILSSHFSRSPASH